MDAFSKLALRHHQNVLFRKVKREEEFIKKKQHGNPKALGKLAVDRVKLEIGEKLGMACSSEETDSTPVDIFAMTLEQPLKIALIQVKSAIGDSRTIHVREKDLSYRRGPVWVICAETTTPDNYAYLVFTYRELCQFVDDKARFYNYPSREWDFTVPKSLAGFEKYLNKWYKIQKCSVSFG